MRVEIIGIEVSTMVYGQLTEDSWKTVYRRVALDQPLTAGNCQMRVIMSGLSRLYSFAVTKH